MNPHLNEDKKYNINDPNRYNFTLSGEPEKPIEREFYSNMSIVVYGINGVPRISYEGKFAIIEQSANRIVFEDENKKRHIILASTGMVIVDQK